MSTILTPPVKGAPEDTSTDHRDCGKLGAEAVCQIRRPGVTLNIGDNATAAMIVNGVNAAQILGVAASLGSGNAADLVNQNIPKGTYVQGLMQCDSNANPIPVGQSNIAHWIPLYSDEAAPHYYQDWNATYPTISNLRACSLVGPNYHALINVIQENAMNGLVWIVRNTDTFWINTYDLGSGLRHIGQAEWAMIQDGVLKSNLTMVYQELNSAALAGVPQN